MDGWGYYWDGVTTGEKRVKNIGQWVWEVWARCTNLQVNRATQQKLKLERNATAVKGLTFFMGSHIYFRQFC